MGMLANKKILITSRASREFYCGNYLGLTFETVSRTLSYFQAKKWVALQAKSVLILDMSALQSQVAHAT